MKNDRFSSPSPPRPKGVVGEGRGEGVATQERSLQLRKNPTDAEKLFWQKIRSRQIGACKFRRQCPVGPYILDFVCFDPKVVIELDGGQHNGSVKDKERDADLYKRGFKVLRFWNNDVLKNVEGVLQSVERELAQLVPGGATPLTPTLSHPRRAGGEGEERELLCSK
jgi:very-short-patch-repair endonuclease